MEPRIELSGMEGSARVKLCRYTCPICGKTRKRLSEGPEARHYVLNELSGHVRMTDDDEHGRKFSVPEAIDRETLVDCIEILDLDADGAIDR